MLATIGAKYYHSHQTNVRASGDGVIEQGGRSQFLGTKLPIRDVRNSVAIGGKRTSRG